MAWSVDSDWDLLTSPDFARSRSQGQLSLDLLRDPVSFLSHKDRLETPRETSA